MSPFIIYPAIDLRRGAVVRLQHGDPQRQTIFGDDPRAAAERWAAAGARWLHVINLDGAFDHNGAANWRALQQIARVGPHVQFGGGLRTSEDMQRAFDAGAQRVILGTVAVERPSLLQQAIQRFGPSRILVALDARDGIVRTRGWQADGGVSALDLGRRVRAAGVLTVIHTDIARDGVLRGVNAAASSSLARHTGLQVIASGGVATLDDVRRTLHVAAQGLCGLIIGRALYDGALELAEALQLASSSRPTPPIQDDPC